MANNLSLTPENYTLKSTQFYDRYGHLCKNTDSVPLDLSRESVHKRACEVLFYDLYAITDKERYIPNYKLPEKPSYPEMAFHFMLLNVGLVPDPSLASSLFGRLRSTLTRIVLWVRSFSLFNSHADEAYQLLGLYNRVKAAAAARLSLAQSDDFGSAATKTILLSDNWKWLCDFEWRLYSTNHPHPEKKEAIAKLAFHMHGLRGQRPTDGLLDFKDNEDFLMEVDGPLWSLMIYRQWLFADIVRAAESYPLFGRARYNPFSDSGALKQRAEMENVLNLMKQHYKRDFEADAQDFYQRHCR